MEGILVGSAAVVVDVGGRRAGAPRDFEGQGGSYVLVCAMRWLQCLQKEDAGAGFLGRMDADVLFLAVLRLVSTSPQEPLPAHMTLKSFNVASITKATLPFARCVFLFTIRT